MREFKNNLKMLETLKRIQARFRGLIVRNKVRSLNPNSKYLRMTPNLSSNIFKEVENSKITEEDIKNLFNKYPPLNDNINVKLKKPIEYEKNNSQYYGELSQDNQKHGRGIQIWEDGSKYEGYWKIL